MPGSMSGIKKTSMENSREIKVKFAAIRGRGVLAFEKKMWISKGGEGQCKFSGNFKGSW